MHHLKPPASTAAFSLSELLIVLTIIAILVALLFPVLKLVRGAAASTTCLANLRQYQTANASYATDWKGSYVPVIYTSPTPGQWSDPWFDNADYIDRLKTDPATRFVAAAGSSLVRRQLCPLAVKQRGQVTSAVSYSYGINQRFALPVLASNGETGYVPRIWMNGIAGKVAFADGLDFLLTVAGASPAMYWTSGVPAVEGLRRFKGTAYRHRARANVVFYDGRAKAVTWDALYVFDQWG